MDNTTFVQKQSITPLAQAWEGLQQGKPGIRIREAAKELGTSEAVLLATAVGKDVVRLDGDWHAFVKRLPELGYVMALTRNDSCILEHKGAFEQISTTGTGNSGVATIIGAIEARFFFYAWHVAFAVEEEKNDRRLTSLQVFDKAGEAILKVYLQEGKSNYRAFTSITEEFRSEDQGQEQHTEAFAPKEYNSALDTDLLLKDWAALQDTHDFHSMLRAHKVHRHHALQLAQSSFTCELDPACTIQLLESASATKLPIMIFVGNRGNVQIHQDLVRTIRVLARGHAAPEEWVNVLDPAFNMHLRQNTIATAWVVRKPTADGDVTAVELYDHHRELVVTFFGLRKPGKPELQAWRDLVATLPVL